jgi:hypothetical protein
MIKRRRQFQTDVKAGLRNQAKRSFTTDGGEITIPPHPGDFGFHYADVTYISMVAQVLENSNYTSWPEQGGLNDQDWDLIQDALTWIRVRDWIEFSEKYPEIASEYDSPAVDKSEGAVILDMSRE